MRPDHNSEIATLAGGCFWCLEAVFNDLRGVERVESGYAGGHDPNPTYQQVCTGTTGHAEVVQVTFDPGVVSYKEILEVFFTIHYPTTLNRQGADVGTQYRSAIFYQTPEQKAGRRGGDGGVERGETLGTRRSSPRSPLSRRSTPPRSITSGITSGTPARGTAVR